MVMRKVFLAGAGAPTGVNGGKGSRWTDLVTGDVYEKSSDSGSYGWAKVQVGVTPIPAPDVTRPAVLSIIPGTGAGNVTVDVKPVVTFTEPMAGTAPNGITLTTDTGAAVAATRTMTGNTITLAPQAPLTAGTSYRVIVASGVTDLAGNALLSAVTARFTTKPVVVPPPDPPPPPPPTPAAALKARLVEDMGTSHEGNLDGVPDGWDWAHNPKRGGGWNDPGPEYNAAIVWGQVYSSASPVEATVEVGNLRLAVLSKSTRTWTVLQATKPAGTLGVDGGYYKSDFGGNESQPGATVNAAGALTGTPNPAWNLHFYPNQRAGINNPDIAGMCMWYDARLAPGSNPAARYLAGAGGDYWQTLDSPYPSNTDIAIGRHRYLTLEWKTLTAHTLSAQDLADYPLPPVTLTGTGTPPVDPPPPPPPPPPVPVGLKAQLLADMRDPHDGPLDGVPPNYDWATRPRQAMGNNPGTFRAVTGWGEAYTSNSPATNTAVEVGNIRVAVLGTDGKWATIQTTKPAGDSAVDGGYYEATFQGNVSQPGAKPGPGGTLIGAPSKGWNFHFYPQGRANLPQGFVGIIAWFDARLVVADPAKPDDRAAARVLAGAGGDYWLDQTAGWPNNGDFAIGRHRWLTVGWQTFTAHTLTPAQIEANPPPVTLAGNPGPPPPPPPVDPPPSPGKWLPPTGRPVRIMLIGDSITAMVAGGGLNQLHAKLSPRLIELVGTEDAGSGVRHEGRGAWCADDTAGRCTHNNGFHAGGMIQNAAGWVAAHTPDVVVINAGTNDRYVQQSFNDTQTAEAVGKLIDVVQTARPQTLVMVTGLKVEGEMPPKGGVDNVELNKQIRAQAAARATAGRPVVYFDAYAQFTSTADFAGEWDVHPSPQGITKIVDSIANTLKQVFA